MHVLTRAPSNSFEVCLELHCAFVLLAEEALISIRTTKVDRELYAALLEACLHSFTYCLS